MLKSVRVHQYTLEAKGSVIGVIYELEYTDGRLEHREVSFKPNGKMKEVVDEEIRLLNQTMEDS